MKRVFLALGLLGLFCLLGAVGSPAAAADYRVVVASDPVFQDFAAAAGDYMDAHFSGTDMLSLSSDPEDWAAMLRYLRALNRSYFGGDLTGLDALDPDGSLAERWLAPGDLTALYVASVLRDAGRDFTAAVLPLPEP